MVVVCDDPDRENEGDLCMAAQFVTAEKIAFLACEARGLICLSLPSQRCDELELPLMVPANDGCEATGFTVSIEARTGVTTGISAADRARTIQVAIDPTAAPRISCDPATSSRCGRAQRRAGAARTDRGRDRSHPPGRPHPGGVLCEVMNSDGTMARACSCRPSAGGTTCRWSPSRRSRRT